LRAGKPEFALDSAAGGRFFHAVFMLSSGKTILASAPGLSAAVASVVVISAVSGAPQGA